MYETPAPPEWVVKRDGRQVPFEADKISRALFAAGEGLGRPDAFLARELADGVVHFLAVEGEGTTPTTAQVAELVVKVVRELGQPALAQAFADCAAARERSTARPRPAAPAGEVVLRFAAGAPLAEVLSACARAYTVQTVFTRDLAAIQNDGLLELSGLEAPAALAGCVLGPPAPGQDLADALAALCRVAAGPVAVDGLEDLPGDPREIGRELVLGLCLAGLRGVVNLNVATPPSWAGDLAAGPLFAGRPGALPAEERAVRADALLDEFLRPGPAAGRVRIDWHLGEADFRPEARPRLLAVARRALDGLPLGFAFDRPRRPPALAEGLDRQHPAVLLVAGLHLPRLAEQTGTADDPERFLHKLGSLARLALSAGVQKRLFLRRQGRAPGAPDVTSGFLLDRARLLVAPVGLEAVVTAFTRRGLCAGGAGLDLGRRILQRLRGVLRQDGLASHLQTCLDGPSAFGLAAPAGRELVAGPTPWDPDASIKGQIRAGAALHAVAEHGTLALFPEGRATPEECADWLRAAWQTDVVRLRLAGPGGSGAIE